MRCPKHAKELVLGLCARCDVFVCELDSLAVAETLFCRDCAAKLDVNNVVDAWPRSHRNPGRRFRSGPRAWRPFAEACELVHSLGLRTSDEWRAYSAGRMPAKGERPSDIPSSPAVVYADEWQGWGHWLGTGRVANANRVFRPFAAAREFARGLGLRNADEWNAFVRGDLPEKGTLPDDVPSAPQQTAAYRSHWKGMGDWLGTGFIANTLRVHRRFVPARAFARSLGLRTGSEWRAFAKGDIPEKGSLPADIPASPAKVYRGSWKGMGDWLGTGAVAHSRRKFRTFAEAREFARGLGLTSPADWLPYAQGILPEKGRRPLDIPYNPARTYPDEWRGMSDFLGLAPRASRPFLAAREHARTLGFTGKKQWYLYASGRMPEKGERPRDVPYHPYLVYSDHWRGWADFLGAQESAT